MVAGTVESGFLTKANGTVSRTASGRGTSLKARAGQLLREGTHAQDGGAESEIEEFRATGEVFQAELGSPRQSA
jgi:hypothetical protein